MLLRSFRMEKATAFALQKCPPYLQEMSSVLPHHWSRLHCCHTPAKLRPKPSWVLQQTNESLHISTTSTVPGKLISAQIFFYPHTFSAKKIVTQILFWPNSFWPKFNFGPKKSTKIWFWPKVFFDPFFSSGHNFFRQNIFSQKKSSWSGIRDLEFRIRDLGFWT